MTRRLLPLVLAATVVALSLGAAHAPAAKAATCDPPTISGTERIGNTLTATAGANCSFTTSGVDLQWYRCNQPTDDPSTCTGLESGSGATLDHVLAQADVGKFMKVVQTVHDTLPVGDTTSSRASGQIKGSPPTASFTVTPNVVLVNHSVTFNGSASTDPDGQALTYQWDFDGNGTVDATTSSPTVSHSYGSVGNKTVILHVVDTDGDVSPAVQHEVRVHGPPHASFTVSPPFATPGQAVLFTSTSTDPDGDPLSYAWDLDGDGKFDDSARRQLHHTYSAAGDYTVSLKVTAADGTSTVFRTFPVLEPAPAPGGGETPSEPKLKLLRPFPRVGIGGFFTSRGVRLTLLQVRAPKGSKVMIRCKGHGCPRRTSRKRVGRKRSVAFRSFRRRFRAGAVIAVYVWKKDRIGKYTRFQIRRNARPSRRDRCLDPVKLKPRRCP